MGVQQFRVAGLVASFLPILTYNLRADVLSVDGAIESITAPPSVRDAAMVSNDTLYIFPERHAVLLENDLTVDVKEPGRYGPRTSTDPAVHGFPQGVVSSGTLVNSYFIHGDSVNGQELLTASVTFDQDILGVIFLSDRLVATHDLLGSPATQYDDNFFNVFGIGDSFELSIDKRTLRLSPAFLGSGADHVRVVTSVPEPTTTVLLGTALVGILLWRRRRVDHL